MSFFKKISHNALEWLLALLKVVVVLFLLAIAKVTLRTNPDIAIPVLISAAVIFVIWWFLPQIKQFFNTD